MRKKQRSDGTFHKQKGSLPRSNGRDGTFHKLNSYRMEELVTMEKLWRYFILGPTIRKNVEKGKQGPKPSTERLRFLEKQTGVRLDITPPKPMDITPSDEDIKDSDTTH